MGFSSLLQAIGLARPNLFQPLDERGVLGRGQTMAGVALCAAVVGLVGVDITALLSRG